MLRLRQMVKVKLLHFFSRLNRESLGDIVIEALTTPNRLTKSIVIVIIRLENSTSNNVEIIHYN